MYVGGIPHARPLWSGPLCGTPTPAHQDPQSPTRCSVMLKMRRWLRVPLPLRSEPRRGRKESAGCFSFFSAYETNVWHSTEHGAAVGLSVNGRSARTRWPPVQLPRRSRAPPLLVSLRAAAPTCSPLTRLHLQLIHPLKCCRCNYSGIFSRTCAVCVCVCLYLKAAARTRKKMGRSM